MKKNIFVGGLFIMAMIFTACTDIPSYPADGNKVQSGSVTCTIDETTVVINPIEPILFASFIGP